MPPVHDEIIKEAGQGISVVWDATEESDAEVLEEVDDVVRKKVVELGELLGIDIVIEDGDVVQVAEVKTSAGTRRREST